MDIFRFIEFFCLVWSRFRSCRKATRFFIKCIAKYSQLNWRRGFGQIFTSQWISSSGANAGFNRGSLPLQIYRQRCRKLCCQLPSLAYRCILPSRSFWSCRHWEYYHCEKTLWTKIISRQNATRCCPNSSWKWFWKRCDIANNHNNAVHFIGSFSHLWNAHIHIVGLWALFRTSAEPKQQWKGLFVLHQIDRKFHDLFKSGHPFLFLCLVGQNFQEKFHWSVSNDCSSILSMCP